MKPPKPVLLSLSLLLGLQPLLRADLVERVIVRVNGDIVTQSEFEARQVASVQAARIGASEVERYLRENNARILQEAVDELLLVQRAAELGYKVPATYLDEVIEGIKKENNIANDDDLRAQLRREGMSLADLRRNIERSVLRRQVLQRELESKTLVSEAEARADYDAHLGDYTREPAVASGGDLPEGRGARDEEPGRGTGGARPGRRALLRPREGALPGCDRLERRRPGHARARRHRPRAGVARVLAGGGRRLGAGPAGRGLPHPQGRREEGGVGGAVHRGA